MKVLTGKEITLQLEHMNIAIMLKTMPKVVKKRLED